MLTHSAAGPQLPSMLPPRAVTFPKPSDSQVATQVQGSLPGVPTEHVRGSPRLLGDDRGACQFFLPPGPGVVLSQARGVGTVGPG